MKENLELVTDVYINRCNDCSCGDTVIHLFKGADSKLQELRPLLNIFPKGPQQKKKQLRIDHPEAFSFNTVWSVRNQHVVTDLPEMYIFYLRCCFQPECVHPLCQQKQKDPNMQLPSTWYSNGPPVSFLPLPVVDLDRPWGNPDCVECSGICHGHYLKPENMLHNHSYVYSPPPSVDIQQFFMQLKGRQPTEDELTAVA